MINKNNHAREMYLTYIKIIWKQIQIQSTNHQLLHNFFTSVLNIPVDNFNHSEYLNISHELKGDKETQGNHFESHINLSVLFRNLP